MHRTKRIEMVRFFRMIVCFLSFFVIISFWGCKSDMPEDVLDEGTMENVLYDYHLAQSLGEKKSAEQITRHSNISYNENYYLKSVLDKYHLSEEDFNRSLEWYTRHSEVLFKIYKNLNERIAADIGTNVSTDGTLYADAATDDTLDIWRGSRAWLLSSVGQNTVSFEQEADTAIHAGDRLMFHFTSNWIYREGMKSAVVSLALKYDNDSTAVMTFPFYSPGNQEFSVVVGTKPLKRIYGYVYQQAQWDAKPKLLVISNVSLIRFRVNAQPVDIRNQSEDADSLQNVQKNHQRSERMLRDSLLHNDSLQRVGHHFK